MVRVITPTLPDIQLLRSTGGLKNKPMSFRLLYGKDLLYATSTFDAHSGHSHTKGLLQATSTFVTHSGRPLTLYPPTFVARSGHPLTWSPIGHAHFCCPFEWPKKRSDLSEKGGKLLWRCSIRNVQAMRLLLWMFRMTTLRGDHYYRRSEWRGDHDYGLSEWWTKGACLWGDHYYEGSEWPTKEAWGDHYECSEWPTLTLEKANVWNDQRPYHTVKGACPE